MQDITLHNLTFAEAIKLHEIGSDKLKSELESQLPYVKLHTRIDRIRSYEDALKALKLSHFDETNLYPREIALRKLELITEALNCGWTPDWNDKNQYKWYGNFYYDNGKFLSSSPSWIRAMSTCYGVVTSRLCFKDEKSAEYASTQFLDLYEVALLG